MTKENLAPWVGEISEPPEQEPTVQTTAYGDEDRDAILEGFRRFCEQLDFRLETFTDHDPSMLEVFDSDANLRAEMIGQHVHTFLGRWLIEPTVSAIDYEYIAEPRRSRPELNQGRDEIRPDFRLIPRQWSGNTPPEIIGEIKTPGGVQSAISDLRNDYLPKTHPPSYGIATDGIVWRGLKREDDGITRFSEVSQVSLRLLLHKIRRDIVHERATYDLAQLRTSDKLSRFMRLFGQIPG